MLKLQTVRWWLTPSDMVVIRGMLETTSAWVIPPDTLAVSQGHIIEAQLIVVAKWTPVAAVTFPMQVPQTSFIAGIPSLDDTLQALLPFRRKLAPMDGYIGTPVYIGTLDTLAILE